MQILIDGLNLALEQGTGIKTYALNLATAASQLGHSIQLLYGKNASNSRDPVVREVTFYDAASPRKGLQFGKPWQFMRDALSGFHPVDIPNNSIVIKNAIEAPGFATYQKYNVPRLFQRANDTFHMLSRFSNVHSPVKPDIAHWTYPMPLREHGAANVYTIHDLVPLRLPYTTTDSKKRFYKLCKQIATTADHIITVSEASRRDIVDILGVDEKRVTNTYQAVQLNATDTPSDEESTRLVEQIYHLPPGGYFLFFGAIEPKKNVKRLIDAFIASTVKAPLVIVGAKAWLSDRELSTLEGLRKAGRAPKNIILLEYVPRNILYALVKQAKAVCFPSIYEGFGLPIIEAMMLETPVLTSNVSCMPEIAGDAAMTVNPYSVHEISRALELLDGSVNLREELATLGRERAKLFSVERYQAQLSNLYKEII
ncbi:TPA: glycosyltransferase family 4 protein [Burkholderia cenocepacia]|uniref:glycosyltransferase family 4 protein n=1 Tax=Burkholderia cenocepacia TaxID=95486 RepID=UPI000F59EE74|nr:glycosyltransferase family 1 protein [Burkholderia cenocepacia]MCA8008875.1 glycosyltransferase family 4 protein [Burkholderia cenocepacia]MDN7544534.1 glycosyltransferase family 1 protein [Burkholderia cenocepacia]MDN7628583.1 glycosyltransferase family 1 protein [Burkholderia cenocepacia]RQU59956.1 glycosyltransferase family 1 protein [Burkholderia cenocepacia]